MEYEEWQKKRMDSLGGSDTGAVMSMNNFASLLTLYVQKKGLVPTSEMSHAAKRGKILEPVIRQITVEDFPQLVIELVPFMFLHPIYPFMPANIDWAIYAPDVVNVRGQDIMGVGGHEIKSAKTNTAWVRTKYPTATTAKSSITWRFWACRGLWCRYISSIVRKSTIT
jgi:hypothetical protein